MDLLDDIVMFSFHSNITASFGDIRVRVLDNKARNMYAITVHFSAFQTDSIKMPQVSYTILKSFGNFERLDENLK
jgi:hypothetical protein